MQAGDWRGRTPAQVGLFFFRCRGLRSPTPPMGGGCAELVPSGCRFRCWCRLRCSHMPLCAAICRSLERKLLIFLGVGFSCQAEGRGFTAKLRLVVQASFAGSQIWPRAPVNRSALDRIGRGRFRLGVPALKMARQRTRNEVNVHQRPHSHIVNHPRPPLRVQPRSSAGRRRAGRRRERESRSRPAGLRPSRNRFPR